MYLNKENNNTVINTELLKRLTANAKVATVLSSIPASTDTVESKGRQMKQCLKKCFKIQKYHPEKTKTENPQ
jgi:hypothetical protein